MKLHSKILTAAVLGLVAFSGNSVKAESDYTSLKAAIDNAVQNTEYTYELENSITGITSGLGAIQGANYALTIDGNNFGLSGNGSVEGFMVGAEQSLILKDIGAYTATYDGDGNVSNVVVTESMNGFMTPSDSRCGVLYNTGTAAITNSVISDNHGDWGGAINNGGNLTISNSVFYQNAGTGRTSVKTEGGGALFNKLNATITDSIFYENQAAKGGAIANVIDKGLTGILTVRNSQFIGNSSFEASSNDRKLSGGAIYNDAIINIIDGSYFAENKASYQGGALTNLGTITAISNTIFENNESDAGLGIIYNYNAGGTVESKIGTLSNVQILNNTGDGIYSSAPITTLSNVEISGNTGDGIELYSTIDTITDSKLSDNDNYGIRFGNSSGNINLIENAEISGNTLGGIYLKDGHISLIKNSSFKNNGSNLGNASGLWMNTDVKIQSDNGTTVFQGNVDKNNPSGIWVNASNKTLTLDQINSGDMYFYDPIRGVTSYYNVDITGDGTGTLYLYNNIVNGKVVTGNTNIDTADGNLFNYSFRSLSTSSDTNWKIDVDFANQAADTIKTATLAQTSVEYVKLKDINFVNGGWDSLEVGDSITKNIRILTTQNNLQLSLASSISGVNVLSTTEVEAASSWDGTINQNTAWSDTYNHWIKDAVNEVVTSEYSITTTGTTNDTLTIEISKLLEGGDIHLGESLDTLMLVNNDIGQTTKYFNAENNGDSYTVLSGTTLGNTKGTVNINGISGGDSETIDLNGTSFILGEGATALNFKDVTVGGSDTVATVSNSAATIKLEDSILNGVVTGTAENNFNMTTAGISEINADVTKANISNTGTLTTTAEHVAGSTVTNSNTLLLSGALAKEILGNGTTKINSDLTFEDGAGIVGTLNMNGATLTVSNGVATNHTVGNIAGNGNISLDFDGTNIDTITLTNDNSEATLTITSLTTPANTTDFSAQVLFGADSNTVLALSDDVLDIYNKTFDKYMSGDTDLTSSTIKWNDNYGTEEWTETYQSVLSVTGSADGLMDTLLYETSMIDETEHIWNPKADNLMLMNKYIGQGAEDRAFLFDTKNDVYKVTADVGTSTAGTFSIIGQAEGQGEERLSSTINFNSHTGFDLDNDDTTLIIKDVNIQNAAYIAKSGNETSVINLDGVKLDGSNGEGIETSGTVNISGNSHIADTITMRSVNSSINIDGSDEVNIDGRLSGVGQLNLENGTVNFKNNAQVTGLDTSLSNVTVALDNESAISGVNLTVNNPSNIILANNKIGTLALNNVTLNSALNMVVDADLANKQMDKITAISAAVNDSINVQKINLLSPTTEKTLSLLFTDNKDLANAVNYTGEGTIAYSPIYKYKTSYDIENDMGYFKFGLVSGKPQPTPSDFNPAVLASPVMAQAGLMQSMNATMHYAFEHLDGFTKFNAKERFARINANKYSIQSTDFNENLSLNSLYDNSGVWAIPYASFENVHLKNGPRVDVNSYGTFTGFDTDIKHLKNGWNTVFTGYLGYNGAHMSYNGVSTNMNGGMIGATQTWYKGNFWTAVTAAAGASVADSDTMYGHEDYTSILSGVGSKTGYNWELAQGKFIIQPIWFMNYSLMKTFDYTNAAGVRINSNPISTIQLNPSVRFIGNLKYGWQPYASVGMVWNLINGTHVKAAGVKLPEMSVKPYVEYGVGVQKQVGDNFTGYMQAMLRNGGRNGVALTGGFRWTLGKKKQKIEKVENTQDTINVSETKPQRKVIKQL